MPRSGELTMSASKDTVPPSSALTPTVTTVGKYFSISAADSSVEAGATFYVPAQNQTRQIDFMVSDTEGRLKEAFGSDVTADGTVAIVSKADSKLLKWSASPVSGGALIVNGITYNTDLADNRESSPASQARGNKFLPIPVVDATTSDTTVSWQLF